MSPSAEAASNNAPVSGNFEEWKETVKQEILHKLRAEFDGHVESLRSTVGSPRPVGIESAVTLAEDTSIMFLPGSAPPPPPPLPPMGVSMPIPREGHRATDTVGTWVV